jgi:hypothetical protein
VFASRFDRQNNEMRSSEHLQMVLVVARISGPSLIAFHMRKTGFSSWLLHHRFDSTRRPRSPRPSVAMSLNLSALSLSLSQPLLLLCVLGAASSSTHRIQRRDERRDGLVRRAQRR